MKYTWPCGHQVEDIKAYYFEFKAFRQTHEIQTINNLVVVTSTRQETTVLALDRIEALRKVHAAIPHAILANEYRAIRLDCKECITNTNR